MVFHVVCLPVMFIVLVSITSDPDKHFFFFVDQCQNTLQCGPLSPCDSSELFGNLLVTSSFDLIVASREMDKAISVVSFKRISQRLGPFYLALLCGTILERTC